MTRNPTMGELKRRKLLRRYSWWYLLPPVFLGTVLSPGIHNHNKQKN